MTYYMHPMGEVSGMPHEVHPRVIQFTLVILAGVCVCVRVCSVYFFIICGLWCGCDVCILFIRPAVICGRTFRMQGYGLHTRLDMCRVPCVCVCLRVLACVCLWLHTTPHRTTDQDRKTSSVCTPVLRLFAPSIYYNYMYK